MKAKDVIQYVGITYRQLDHWCRLGIIKPVDTPTPGSGVSRDFPVEEVERIAVVARLLRIGFGLAEARKIAETGERHIYLGEGVTIHIDQVRASLSATSIPASHPQQGQRS